MPEITKTLGIIYRGQASKPTHIKYLLALIALFFIAVTVAVGFFPAPGYTPLNNHVSDMGGIARNPTVWWFFDASIIGIGILMIPQFVYLYRRLMPTTKWLTRLAMICGVVGCIGFSVLGMFPQDIPDPHDIAADLAFGGLGLAAFLTMFILLRKKWVRESWPSWKAFLLVYGPLYITITLIIVMPNLDPVAGIDPRWFSWTPWQWTALLSVLYWLVIITFITPDLPPGHLKASPNSLKERD